MKDRQGDRQPGWKTEEEKLPQGRGHVHKTHLPPSLSLSLSLSVFVCVCACVSVCVCVCEHLYPRVRAWVWVRVW